MAAAGIKKLNSSIDIPSCDEDCSKGRSDMGNQKQQTLKKAAKQKTQSKTSKLLANPDIKRWYDNLARSSPTTAGPRLRKLSGFCELHQMTPMELAELGMKDLRATSDLLQDHITWMEEQGKAPQYIKSVMTATKSWLAHFDIRVTRKLRIANVDSTPTLENERVPQGNEMAEVMSRSDLFAGAAISLISKAGLRPETLGNHDGTDGLMMKDLPDIVIQQGVARVLQTPPMIVVRKTLSKAGHQYWTCISAGGTKRLLAYLNDRLVNGESLNAESPVLSADSVYVYRACRGTNVGKPFLPTAQVTRRIRETLRPRFQWRPYVFRSYFDTELLIAEARGKIAHDFRVFFMGHKGSIEAKYTTNKGVLPDDLVKEMRAAFKRSEEFLDLEVREEDPLLKQKEQIQSAIAVATPEQLGQMQEVLQKMGIGKFVQASA
ncbi:MAG: site-specific integrase [Nitrososphaera sp.]